jgi:formylglycine-generating enzyme required for sulfatase activity
MAFALNQLYQHGRTKTGLSLDYYENELGGVQGAIDRQAEAAIARLKRDRRFDEGALQVLFFDLVEVNDQGVATRRRVSQKAVKKSPAKKTLANALVEARVLVTDHETASTYEVAHEAVFTGWKRLGKWIEENADTMRVCRNLKMAALDWKENGSPRFSYLPDGATLRQYRGVQAKCRHGGDHALAVVGYLKAAKRRRLLWGGAMVLAALIGAVVGLDSWRAYRSMSWNAVRIWALARAGLYKGPSMTFVPAGCFVMGCQLEERNCPPKESPPRRVCVDAFEIGRHEVTQELWMAVMGENPSVFAHKGPRHPVENVSWDEVKAFLRRLDRFTGKTYRLPTEAEWEYAARGGGNRHAYAGGGMLAEVGWCDIGGGPAGPREVGLLRPNGFGIYDMSGNVWEWMEDDWHETYSGAPENGRPWVDDPRGNQRVIRGGAWSNAAEDCRAAARSASQVGFRYNGLGFRIARSRAPQSLSITPAPVKPSAAASGRSQQKVKLTPSAHE